MRTNAWSLVAAAAAALLACPPVSRAQPEPASRPAAEASGTVLDLQRTLVRVCTVRETVEMVLPSGQVEHARVVCERNAPAWFRDKPDQAELPADLYKIEQTAVVRLPSDLPADWMKPAFDDGDWARLRGPVLDESWDEQWKAILVRAPFEVTDPAAAGGLTLSLTIRGGAVVYLNGREVGRRFMPDGPVDACTPAEPYPLEAYFTADGFGVNREKAPPAILEKRARRAELAIPAESLIKGVNVLAVGLHRSPATYLEYVRRSGKGTGPVGVSEQWAKVMLADLRLAAAPEAVAAGAVVPNVALLAGRGFKVWNQSVMQKVFLPDYPDPYAALAPVHFTGVQNGSFARQLVVGDDRPIRGLKVVVSDFKGPAVLPAAAATVRYAVPDGAGEPASFDSLEDDPPAEVPVYEQHGGSLQPIWMTVTVPPDAKPGRYAATAAISAEGVAPRAVPLELHVADWSLPPVDKYATTMDIIESPESVAMAYDVPLWSDAHFKLLDRTFSLLGPLGVKTLYITTVRRTHFGNEHAMIRWVRGDDGELTPDFSIMEKYLDVAVRHIGRPRGIILYCWEPWESQGHASHYSGTSDQQIVDAGIFDRPILITTVDPATGRMSPRKGPAWGSPEAGSFWKKLTDGVRPVLRKRGLEDAMLFGLVGDRRPTKQAMDDICSGVAEARWAIHSHLYCDTWQGYRMGFTIALWGIGCNPADPSAGYSFGWSNPLWLSYYPREMKLTSTLVEHRTKLENWMGAIRPYSPFLDKGHGPRGLGRIGGDFWPVISDGRGRLRVRLVGRYPESAWGQLNLEFCIPQILGKGKNGAVPTVRSEAFREGLQETEARVFLEKAWLDDEAPKLLGEELMARIRRVLDERIRMLLNAGIHTGSHNANTHGEGDPWYISSGWSDRTQTLFDLAAEAARKLRREPRPNLTVEPPKK